MCIGSVCHGTAMQVRGQFVVHSNLWILLVSEILCSYVCHAVFLLDFGYSPVCLPFSLVCWSYGCVYWYFWLLNKYKRILQGSGSPYRPIFHVLYKLWILLCLSWCYNCHQTPKDQPPNQRMFSQFFTWITQVFFQKCFCVFFLKLRCLESFSCKVFTHHQIIVYPWLLSHFMQDSIISEWV